MNNTGSDNSSTVDEVTQSSESRSVPIRVLVMGAVAVILAVVIGSQVIGVLYAIFFPPVAPLPEQSTLVTHTSADYGVDDWLYTSTMPACDIVRFYIENGTQCRVAPLWCTGEGESSAVIPHERNQNIGRCEATQTFSIFALRYEVIIATGATLDEVSQFRLNREIYWTGAVPPYNPPTLDSDFSAG